MRLKELLKVIYPYTEIQLYNDNNENLGFWYGANYITDWQDNKVTQVSATEEGTMEIWISK